MLHSVYRACRTPIHIESLTNNKEVKHSFKFIEILKECIAFISIATKDWKKNSLQRASNLGSTMQNVSDHGEIKINKINKRQGNLIYL